MRSALVKAAKTIGAERLQDANVDVGVVVAMEGFAIESDETREPVKIMIEKLLAEIRRQVGLGIVQERGDVILQSAFAAAVIFHEKGIAIAQQDVAGLKITIKKVIAGGAQEKFGQAAEIVFERLFVEGDPGKAEKIIFEIVQIPGDGLAVKAGDGIANTVIQVAASFDLEAREHGDNLAIGFDDLGSNVLAGAVFGEEFEERGVAEVFFKIGAVAEVFGVNFRNGKAVAEEMFGEFEKSGVLFADAVENAYGAVLLIGEPDDFAPRTAEFALQRLDTVGRGVEILLEEIFENVHSIDFCHSGPANCR